MQAISFKTAEIYSQFPAGLKISWELGSQVPEENPALVFVPLYVLLNHSSFTKCPASCFPFFAVFLFYACLINCTQSKVCFNNVHDWRNRFFHMSVEDALTLDQKFDRPDLAWVTNYKMLPILVSVQVCIFLSWHQKNELQRQKIK